jgi:2-methylisocitrate lyase-like PEP mutase family enzyme
VKRLAPYWKAIVAFGAPGCALLITGAGDGWTATELAVAGLTCVVTAGAVYAAPPKVVRDDHTTDHPEV